MAQQDINLGTAPEGKDGDTTRSAMKKIQANFTELYSVKLSNTGGVVGNQSTGWAPINAPTLRVVDVFSGTNGGLALESYQPLIQFIDRTANSANTRLLQNAGTLQIQNDTVGDGVWRTPGIYLHGDGCMAIGGLPSSNAQMYLRGTSFGTGTSQWGVYVNTEFNEASTGNGYGVSAVLKVKDAPFTMANLYGVLAGTPTIGAQAIVTNYDAFAAFDASLAGTPTRVAGMRLRMTAGTNKWNIYADGSAPSYHNGQLRLGTAADDGSGARLQVLGTATADTPAAGDRSRRLATTEYVLNAIGTPSFQNKIINGNFLIWQRGITGTGGGYVADRWYFHQAGGATVSVNRRLFTAGQTEVPGNPVYYCESVVTSGADAVNTAALMQQPIENVMTLSGEQALVSFWAKANKAVQVAVELMQSFGTGGSAAVAGIGGVKVNLTTSWQRFTVPVTIPSIAGKAVGASSSLVLCLWFDAGTNFNARTNSLGKVAGGSATISIAQVQIKEGLHDTPFEDRPWGVELDLCRRYCVAYAPGVFAGIGNMVSNSTGRIGLWGTEKLRAPPTVAIVGTGTQCNLFAGDAGGPVNGFFQVYWGTNSGTTIVVTTSVGIGMGRAVEFYTEGRTLVVSAEL